MKALGGKQQDLFDTLSEVKEYFPSFTVTKSGGQNVVVEIPTPDNKMGTEAQDNLKLGMKSDPEATTELELSFGRTLEEMHSQKGTMYLPDVPNGVSLKVSVAFASEVLKAMLEAAEGAAEQMGGKGRGRGGRGGGRGRGGGGPEPPIEELLMALSGISGKLEFNYKPEGQREDLYKKMPTLEQGLNLLKGPLSGMPPPLRDVVKKLPDSCDGVEKLTFGGEGLPEELIMTFTNFKPMKLLGDVIKELP